MGGPGAPAPRALAAVRELGWSALGEALSADEKSRLGVALYDASGEYRSEHRPPWEDRWLARWLPPAPPPSEPHPATAGQATPPSKPHAAPAHTPPPSDGSTATGPADPPSKPHAAPAHTPPPNEPARTPPPNEPHMERVGRATASARTGGESGAQRGVRVLVGAAGGGREVLFFVGRGCDVMALEPSGALRCLCGARAPGVPLIAARYEDVASGRVSVGGEFDAVLLGLGSLSHVLDGATRLSLLRALADACPRGPILASVLAPPRAHASRRGAARLGAGSTIGRAAAIGRAIGAAVRARRSLPPREIGEVMFGGLGFARLFERDELRSLAASIGRRAVLEDDPPDGMELCAFLP